MLLLLQFIHTKSIIYSNPQFAANTHYISVIPIIQNETIVLIGNQDIGEFTFPRVLQNADESGHMAAKRAAFDQSGCAGDVTFQPFLIEGNLSWYVMDVNREDAEWGDRFQNRKHVSLIEVENDYTIGDHEKYVINECNLQGYVVY